MVTGYVAKSVEHKLELEKLLNGNTTTQENKTLEDKIFKNPPYLD